MTRPSLLTWLAAMLGGAGACLLPLVSASAQESPPTTVTEFRRLSVEDPRTSLERGEALLATPYAAAHPEWSREVLFRMARAAMLLSDNPRTEEIAARLEKLGRERADAVAQAYGRIAQGGVWADAGKVEDAIDAATKAATSLDATGDSTLQAVASAEMCDVAVRATRTDLGKLHCEEARARWEALGDPFQVGRAENYLSIIARDGDRLDDAIRLGKRARANFLRAGTPALAAMMDDNLAGMYLDKGDAATALRLSQGALAHELAAGKVQHAALSRMNIARALTLLGHHGEALAAIAQAIEDAKRTAYDVALPDLYEVQLHAAQAAGQPALAVTAAEASLEVVRRLAGEEAQRAIAEMEARYRALEKQRQIDQLAQSNHIKALELETAAARLRKEQLGLALVAVAGGSLAVVSFLLVLLLREGRRRERELDILSRTDPLTGAANRRALMFTLEKVFDTARGNGAPAALWVIDADHFKRINDEHGHHVGDLVLRELVARVRANIRATDTLGRLGGEEFGLVLPGATAEDAVQRAEVVRRAIADTPVSTGQRPVSVTVSIGVAMLEVRRHPSVEQWLDDADGAVYAAKHAGRNRVELAAAAGGQP